MEREESALPTEASVLSLSLWLAVASVNAGKASQGPQRSLSLRVPSREILGFQ